MTRGRANALKEVFNAFCEGKQIQCCNDYDYVWRDTSELLDGKHRKYRIKPTEEYCPYKDCDELIEDYKSRFNAICPPHVLPLIWVKNKWSGIRLLITAFYEDNVYFDAEARTLKDIFEKYTYLDGTPCGKKGEV